jgi:hypothetical protein
MNKDGALSAWEFLTRARPQDYQGQSYTKYLYTPFDTEGAIRIDSPVID